MSVETRQKAKILAETLFDKGLIIEGGWSGFRTLVIHKNAPEIQVTEMRKAFFAGAYHLFTSIIGMLGEGEEITEVELTRLDAVNKELNQFIEDLKQEQAK